MFILSLMHFHMFIENMIHVNKSLSLKNNSLNDSYIIYVGIVVFKEITGSN